MTSQKTLIYFDMVLCKGVNNKQILNIIQDCILQLIYEVELQVIFEENYSIPYLKQLIPFYTHALQCRPKPKLLGNYYVILAILHGLTESPSTLTEEKMEIIKKI